MNYFVTAISTDSGKTLVSAILCEALQADYWKPIQAGEPRDSMAIKGLVTNSKTFVHPEAYALKMPASPHASARAEGITIYLDKIKLPETKNSLVVEGAGGALVPLNDTESVIDLASVFRLNVILVSNYYLGSINHTLLTYEALLSRRLTVAGIIFNGDRNEESRRIILSRTKLKCLLDIDREHEVTPATVRKYAKLLYENWF